MRRLFRDLWMVFVGVIIGWTFYGYAVSQHPDNMNFLYALIDLSSDIGLTTVSLSSLTALATAVTVLVTTMRKAKKDGT